MKNKIKDKNKSHNIDLFVWCSILFLGIIMMFNEKTDVISFLIVGYSLGNITVITRRK